MAFAASYCVIVNVSRPEGAVSGTVHERPVWVVVQFGDVTLISATVAAPPFTVIDSETAEADTYLGARLAAAVAAAGMVSTNAPASVVALGVLGAVELPPPPQPARAAANDATIRRT